MHYNIIIKVICIRFHVHQNIFTLCYNFMCMKKHIFQNLVLSAALLAGCAGTASPAAPAVQTFQNVTIDSGFDTVITLVEQTSDQEAFQAHYDTMCEQFSRYNSLFDIYNTYEGIASLKTINDSAGIAPVAVSEEVIDMLEQAKEICELSDGAFDITMGSLLQVWHRYREDGLAANEQGKRGSLPDPAELETAASHRGFEHVIIDREAGTVFIDDAQVSLDAGGIAKGFSAERTARVLEQNGTMHAAINAGGNNRTIGAKADGSPWNVGIQNPDGQGSLFVVRVTGTNSFVTSGDYERYYIAEGDVKLHHIIDPVTNMPADRYRSVTIITPDSGAADALSTALFVLPYKDGEALLKKYTEKTGDPAEAIWIMAKDKAQDAPHTHRLGLYTIAWTDGLEGSLVWN